MFLTTVSWVVGSASRKDYERVGCLRGYLRPYVDLASRFTFAYTLLVMKYGRRSNSPPMQCSAHMVSGNDLVFPPERVVSARATSSTPATVRCAQASEALPQNLTNHCAPPLSGRPIGSLQNGLNVITVRCTESDQGNPTERRASESAKATRNPLVVNPSHHQLEVSH